MAGEDTLGDDYLQFPWAKPSVEIAKRAAERQKFHLGKASLSFKETTTEDLNAMGEGVGIFFDMIYSLSGLLLVASLLSIPAIVLSISGNDGHASTVCARAFR